MSWFRKWIESEKKEFLKRFAELREALALIKTEGILRFPLIMLMLYFVVFVFLPLIFYKMDMVSEDFMWNIFGPLLLIFFILTIPCALLKSKKLGIIKTSIVLMMNFAAIIGIILFYLTYRYSFLDENFSSIYMVIAMLCYGISILSIYVIDIIETIKRKLGPKK